MTHENWIRLVFFIAGAVVPYGLYYLVLIGIHIFTPQDKESVRIMRRISPTSFMPPITSKDMQNARDRIP